MQKFIIFMVLCFSVTSQAYDNFRLNGLEKYHNSCIANTLEKTYSKVTCEQKIDFVKTNQKIKYACDQLMEQQLAEPNSHSALNDQRNLREKTALKAYSAFETKVANLDRNCQVAKSLKKELKKKPSNIIKIYTNGSVY